MVTHQYKEVIKNVFSLILFRILFIKNYKIKKIHMAFSDL